MCKCPKVEYFDVMHITVGHGLVPYHKNCGEVLSETQAQKYDQDRISRWEGERTRARVLTAELAKKMPSPAEGSVYRCLDCGHVSTQEVSSCPVCKSNRVRPVSLA